MIDTKDLVENFDLPPAFLSAVNNQIKNKIYAVRFYLESKSEKFDEEYTYRLRSANCHFKLDPTGSVVKKLKTGEKTVDTYDDPQYERTVKKLVKKKTKTTDSVYEETLKKFKTKAMISVKGETTKHFAFLFSLYLEEITGIFNSEKHIAKPEELREKFEDDDLTYFIFKLKDHDLKLFNIENIGEYTKHRNKIMKAFAKGNSVIEEAVKKALSRCDRCPNAELIHYVSAAFIKFIDYIVVNAGMASCIEGGSVTFKSITAYIAAAMVQNGANYDYVDVLLSTTKYIDDWDLHRSKIKEARKSKTKTKKPKKPKKNEEDDLDDMDSVEDENDEEE